MCGHGGTRDVAYVLLKHCNGKRMEWMKESQKYMISLYETDRRSRLFDLGDLNRVQ